MICPYCGSPKVVRNGLSVSNIISRQRYKCMECERRFTEEDTIREEAPSILFFDIETLPIVAYTWGTWGVDITNDKIIKDWCVLAFSAKWLGDDRIVADILTPKEVATRNDKRLCQHVWKLLDDADLVVAQNGKRFDLPKMNGRFWKWRMGPTSSYRVVDTMEAAKKVFGLTYNSLDFFGEYLGAGRKLKTEFQLWADCDRGNKDALDRMTEYNQQDTLLLENVYNKMRPWIPGHPRLTAYEKVIGVCPVCLGEYETIGVYTAAQRQYSEHRCLNCHAVFHDTKPIKNG
jgi:uncharacterized protein YprB with RNaseH-like and TPR domain